MVQVKIGNCTINGIHKKNIDVFLGIPYAKSFNKISRFQHSKLMELSKPMIDATHIQSIPPQPYNSLEDFFSMTDSSFNSFKQNDYCLFLNIWKPSSNQNHLPVVI
ncbi:MAG: carboxylesterase family protein, partial [Staphylococcus epidermidis]|nr:carboxylesterase family protein [Staphylococcus epidermidis]